MSTENKFPPLKVTLKFDDPNIPAPYYYAFQCSAINPGSDSTEDNVTYITDVDNHHLFFRAPVEWLRNEKKTPMELKAYRFETDDPANMVSVRIDNIDPKQFQIDRLRKELFNKKKLLAAHIEEHGNLLDRVKLLKSTIETLQNEIHSMNRTIDQLIS